MNLTRYFISFYLLGLLLTGIGYLGILPIFEGIDEPAHFSSLRQVADSGTIPVTGRSFLDDTVSLYWGPMHYSTGAPPFDLGRTYRKFFARPDLVRQYGPAYRTSSPPTPFHASRGINWEAQQPPVYYAVMAPFDWAADFLSLSFYSRIFLLRLVSYGIALIGVAFGFAAARDTSSPPALDPAVIGFLFYPLLLPQFFEEFGRMGNDALCLFWVGLTAFLLSKWIRRDQDRGLSLGIGMVLGLGLLTKAFFVPIIAALGLWLLIRQFSGDRAASPKKWLPLCLIILPALLIGGGWYIFNYFAVGTLSGSRDMLHLANQGGFAANLRKNFSFSLLLNGIAAMFATYSWGGTWSLVRMPVMLQILIALPAAAAVTAFLVRLKNCRPASREVLGVIVFVVFATALVYYMVASIALTGIAGTPGWYLHILMPWMAPCLGVGILSLFRSRALRPWLAGLTILYPIFFQAAAFWLQMSLFAGCATKGTDKYYSLPGHAYCLDQFGTVIGRMEILGSPQLAAACLLAGMGCFIILLRSLTWSASGSGVAHL